MADMDDSEMIPVTVTNFMMKLLHQETNFTLNVSSAKALLYI